MRIGELAHAAGVSTQTIRFYESQGLLPSAAREANGYRIYDTTSLARLRFIHNAQAAGFSLSEIGSIIDVRQHGTKPCTHVDDLIETKIADVRTRIEHLATLQAELEALLERSRRLDPADCGDDAVCHVLNPTN